MSAVLRVNRIDWARDGLGLIVDLLMIALVIFNLSLILFDWLFGSLLIQQQLQQYLPSFTEWYRVTVHEDFTSIDLAFVYIYLTEFAIRWLVAIVRKDYHHWLIYPIAHWYDLLGCIPVGSFRWLRVLRIVSLLMRLQKRGIVDLSNTWLGATLLHYLNIVVEEVSDRVVINVLEGVQKDMVKGSPLLHNIQRNVLAPRKQMLVDMLLDTLGNTASSSHAQWRQPLGNYLANFTDEAITRTSSGNLLSAIPVAGPRAISLLGNTVRELGLALSDQLVADLNNPAKRPALEETLLEMLNSNNLPSDPDLDAMIRQALLDIIEEIKAQVAIKHWMTPQPDRAQAPTTTGDTHDHN